MTAMATVTATATATAAATTTAAPAACIEASPRSAHPLLKAATPAAWIVQACAETDVLLIDHSNCEKKAASTALSLINNRAALSDRRIRCQIAMARSEILLTRLKTP